MARFRYRMQSILDLKLKLENQAKIEFAAARIRLDEEERKQQALIERKNMYEDEGRRLREKKLDFQKLRENEQAVKCMEEFILQQKLVIKTAEQALEEARAKLQEISIERKMQEKLRERAFEEYLREEDHNERKEVDELTSYAYGQRMG